MADSKVMNDINNSYLNNIHQIGSKTENGTKIVGRDYNTLGKEAFLTILAAELANQDPTQNVDSTQYVSQLAQFSSLEQMSNLNSTMTNYAERSLVGKYVTVSEVDASGQYITGLVKNIVQSGGKSSITLEVPKDGGGTEMKTFDVGKVISVVQGDDAYLGPIINITGNTGFLLASSFMGKEVELSEKDESGNFITGIVSSVYKDKGEVKVLVTTPNGDTKEVTYDKVTKVSNTTDGDKNE
ncbi:MAG: flagellar hook capping FlgD N-terminal domain-containing protein [Clostridiaceae bacterium]|nr:flagellar hook capping FlgD N-terminal domain-containing protein [Clostridiaceae bacterium]